MAEATAERTSWPELWRLHGELLLASAGPGGASRGQRGVGREAEGSLRQAVRVARAAGARSLELRAAASLARAWHARGRQ